MGLKYSINSAGRIVAERDIYSLGGFIPKGRLGGAIKDETQLSQEGECWLAKGDISNRPDIVIKDNAYIGEFTPGSNPVHTDGITEFSGNTLIPGNISIRCFTTDPKNNMFVKDSFIGISMDILCGPATTTTAFPFEQGGFNKDVPKGTLFTSASMHTGDANICRTTANLRIGRDTYIYIPTGYNCRILWGYWDTNGQLAYSGESFAVSQALTKLSHPVYKLAMVHISKANGTAMTPANLLATGAKILGHISGSLLLDVRPESVSGEYVMVNSSLIATSGNFGLATTQLRFLAGGLYNTNMYTDRAEMKPYGTFRNVERVEYLQYFGDIHRGNANRDHYITASDCPLVRVNSNFVTGDILDNGGVTLRNCIVPKAEFQNDIINGNTYEDIDFSYANEALGTIMTGYTRFISSHRQGIYRLYLSGGFTNGLVSHKGNLDSSGKLFPESKSIPLDGNIIEQGTYYSEYVFYENAKHDDATRVRMKTPLPTRGSVFPSLPSGFGVRAILYLDENFVCKLPVTEPTKLETTYPYYVACFRKDNLDSKITASEFIALNASLTMLYYTKVPEITGSAYVGAGCTVRGDVQLHGDPYVNRVFDINVWERGENTMISQQTWEDGKNLTNQERHVEFKEAFPVEAGGTISADSGYFIYAGWMDENKRIIATSGVWAASFTVPAYAKYVGLVLKKAGSAEATGVFIDYSDIPLANVKYLRAFKKRRYITNELDRKSPEDILLDPDYWEQGVVSRTVGKIYSDLKQDSPNYIRLRTPVNTGKNTLISQQAGFAKIVISLDAFTKCRSEVSEIIEGTPLLAVVWRKDPTSATVPSDISSVRMVIEFVPSPRIIALYDSPSIEINGTKVRMYDNSVLSKTLKVEGELILKDDAVARYDYGIGECLCGNGHSDALIKLP